MFLNSKSAKSATSQHPASVASVEGAEPRGALGGLLEKPSKEKSIEAGGHAAESRANHFEVGWKPIGCL